MEPIYTSCCGLDVHKKSVQGCVRRIGKDGKVQHEVRPFGTMTQDIMALADWLSQEEVTHVAMESTGVYGSPSTTFLREIQHPACKRKAYQECPWKKD